MRVAVITYGTEGDTRPLIALCHGLICAGHEVRLLTDRSSYKTAEALAVPMQPLAGDIKAMFGPGGELAKLMKKGGGGLKLTMAMATMASGLTSAWMKCFVDQARGADVVLFCGITSYVGQSVAEYLGIPAICIALWPISPTRDFPPPALPPWKIPPVLNRASHLFVNAFTWMVFRKAINMARRDVCGQAPRLWMWRDFPILYGMSRHLVPPPADWPKNHKVCGAWSAKTEQPNPSAALSAFLAAGTPPIYIGFGSMAGFDKKQMLGVVIDAVGKRRALFFPGWNKIDASQLPDNFFILNDGPNDWVFPHTSMVIHHGGAGTTHAAARAGVPAIAIPFAGNQFFWAERLAWAGVAPKYVPNQPLDAKTLAAKIEFAERPEVQAKAKALGAAMAQENGVAIAVAEIENFVKTARKE